jgi:sortase A
MTTVEAPEQVVERARDKPAPTTKVGWLPSAARQRVPRISLIGAIVVVALLMLFLGFEGPVGRVWYETRQRQLASDLAKPHPTIERGDAIAVLQIPRIDVNLVVAEGDDPQQLRGGPGHRIGTPKPGSKGNAILAGHRSAWGGPFADIARLKKGDLVAVSIGTQPEPAVYTVASVTKTSGQHISALAKSSDFLLTLIAGDGGRLSSDRVVVTAISGTAQRRAPERNGPVAASTSAGSAIRNLPMLLVLIGAAGVLATLLVLRKKTSIVPLVAVLAPFGVLALLGVLLEVDLLLPALR